MSAAPIHLLGERLMLDPAGILYWPSAQTLVVSDLHLEKGSAFARKGMLLPPWDTQATLDRLSLSLRRWRPKTVVTLGDSFHDNGGPARLPARERERLAMMTAAHDFIWVLGNHDPQPPEGIGGRFVEEFTTHPLTFRHQSRGSAEMGEIVGHHHPKAAVPTRGTVVSRSCFVTDARRVMMPAFGAYTGGLDVCDAAIAGLFAGPFHAYMLGHARVYAIPRRVAV